MMRLPGLLVVLLCCCGSFLQTIASNSSCNCNQLKTVRFPPGGVAEVPCPALSPRHTGFKFQLLRNGEHVYGETVSTDGPARKPGGARRAVERNGTWALRLDGLNGSSQGVYRCEAKGVLPPPVVVLSDSPSVLLLLLEERRCDAHREEVRSEGGGAWWTWMVVAAVAAVYGLVVTVALAVSCVRLRLVDSEGEYMNTKPPAPRAHWRKS